MDTQVEDSQEVQEDDSQDVIEAATSYYQQRAAAWGELEETVTQLYNQWAANMPASWIQEAGITFRLWKRKHIPRISVEASIEEIQDLTNKLKEGLNDND